MADGRPPLHVLPLQPLQIQIVSLVQPDDVGTQVVPQI